MIKRILPLVFLALALVACVQEPVTAVPVEDDLDVAALVAWSSPSSWLSGKVPVAGEAVHIPRGKSILLDVSPPNLKSLQIDGNLVFDNKDLNLTANYIVVHGRLRIGTLAVPYAHKATITLNARDMTQNIMGMGTRGILVMGGKLELFGTPPTLAWTKINASLAKGAKRLILKDSVNWKANDKVIVAPTDFFPHDANFNNPDAKAIATELLTVASVSANTLNVTTGLRKARWGQLQYVNASGMTTTPTTSVSSLVLDERAAVGNLTRNIVIQSANDSLWTNQGFGAHVMVMSGGGIRANGVEFRRMGQLGKTGRYPIHWHMLSYNQDTGALISDATGQYVKNSSVWDSSNRCMTLHGTNGVTVSNNICYDILGHAIFLEDAVERRNILEKNLVLQVRVPPRGETAPSVCTQIIDGQRDCRVLGHDAEPAGFWLTNPDNTVRGNQVGDSEGKGFWLAFPKQAIGLSQKVRVRPDRTPFGIFADNTAHSSYEGIHMDSVPKKDDPGSTEGNMYAPMKSNYDPTVETDYDTSKWLRFKLERVTLYKNGISWNEGAFWNRASWPDYINWVSADNTGGYFRGAGFKGRITGSLLIGTSLNNAIPSPNRNLPIVALASYHSAFDMDNNVIVNFPFVAKWPGSGAFKTDDYYLIAVDKGLVRNPNNRLINSSPGYRVPPPNMRPDAHPNGKDNWTLAGALWDAHGYWGPKGNFWVYDVPFLTSGANCQAVVPAGQNGMSCSGQYYGVQGYMTNFDANRYGFAAPVEVSRRNPANMTQEIGKWTVADGNVSNMLGNMRHFAARTGGSYVLRFPKRTGSGYELPKWLELDVTNAFRSTDWFMLGVSFDGKITPAQVHLDFSEIRAMSAASSYAEVAASQGTKYWQDKTQNLIWVKIRGGLSNADHAQALQNDPKSDYALYGDMRLFINR